MKGLIRLIIGILVVFAAVEPTRETSILVTILVGGIGVLITWSGVNALHSVGKE